MPGVCHRVINRGRKLAISLPQEDRNLAGIVVRDYQIEFPVSIKVSRCHTAGSAGESHRWGDEERRWRGRLHP